MDAMLTLFLLMAFVHFLADYPLQGDFLAKFKNRYNPDLHADYRAAMGLPSANAALMAHAGIHALGVYLITQSILLACVEWVLHAAIDDAKCRGKLTFNQDQALHIGCKLLYVLFLPLFT